MTTDINIINVNGLDYPIKDQEARDVAESAVKIFAYYEDGLVASQAYATIGTPICWKGELYYTTTTVAKGNIWAVGVNLRVGDKAGLIINRINDVESELTANGNRIYMDYKNGKYGYNTSPSRGADTFFPFRSIPGGTPTAISLPYTATEDCIVFVAGTFPGLWNDGFDSRWGQVDIKKNNVTVRSVRESLNTTVGPDEWHAKMGIPLASWCGGLEAGDTVSIAFSSNGYSGGNRYNAWVMKP